MTNKVAFFYCTGTVSTTAEFAKAADFDYNAPIDGNQDFAVIPGLNGQTFPFFASPAKDPFPLLLDPDIFEPRRKIAYKASSTGIVDLWTSGVTLRTMGQSIEDGMSKVIAEITALPAGQKFCLGGLSQGAAVMSGVYMQGLKPGTTGPLTSRRDDFLAFVGFGNPRRALNYRGSVGGTWSGGFDVPGSTTGGHGSFPATGQYARLTDPEPLKWIDFANEDDVITSVGDSPLGTAWVAGNNIFLGTATAVDWAVSVVGLPLIIGAVQQTFTFAGGAVPGIFDATGREIQVPGMGHVTYALAPPPGDPNNGMSSYQIAAQFLTDKALEYATAPVVLPSLPTTPTTAGWSTTLVPPAA